MPPINGDIDSNGEAAAPSVSDDTAVSSGSDPFDGLSGDIDELAPDIPGEVSAGESDEAAPPVQQTDQLEQDAQAFQGQEPQQTQQQQAQVDQSGDANLFPDSTASLTQMLQVLTQAEPQLVQAVAQQQFQLTEAEREALETDAVSALPQLAAKIYVKNLQAMVNFAKNALPSVLQQEMNKQQGLMAVEQAFFQEFPQLNRWQHGSDIVAVGQALRAQNPQMPAPQLLQHIARAVMAMHGIQPRRGNGQQPFVPAPSGPTGPTINLAEEIPYLGLGLEYDE
jgi:hypothetical protein